MTSRWLITLRNATQASLSCHRLLVVLFQKRSGVLFQNKNLILIYFYMSVGFVVWPCVSFSLLVFLLNCLASSILHKPYTPHRLQLSALAWFIAPLAVPLYLLSLCSSEVIKLRVRRLVRTWSKFTALAICCLVAVSRKHTKCRKEFTRDPIYCFMSILLQIQFFSVLIFLLKV